MYVEGSMSVRKKEKVIYQWKGEGTFQGGSQRQPQEPSPGCLPRESCQIFFFILMVTFFRDKKFYLVISSCSEERFGGVAPSFSAQDSTYLKIQSGHIIQSFQFSVVASYSVTRRSQSPSCPRGCCPGLQLPKEQSWQDLESFKTHHGRYAKLHSKGKVNVLPSNNHDEVVEEAKADEGKRVVIRQLS